MSIDSAVILVILLPSVVYAQLICHRCFGNSFCNDANHQDFPGSVHNATCGSVSYFSHEASDDPFVKDIERVLNANYKKTFESVGPYDTAIEQMCITATVHESFDTHTLRTCISRRVPTNTDSQSLCEFLNDYLVPSNYYNGSFSCRQCPENYCNIHTLIEGDGLREANYAESNALKTPISFLLITLLFIKYNMC